MLAQAFPASEVLAAAMRDSIGHFHVVGGFISSEMGKPPAVAEFGRLVGLDLSGVVLDYDCNGGFHGNHTVLSN